MADLISRLKLESSEFDSKIQRATKGLLTMEQECRKIGGTLEYVEKEQLDFVKGLGQMETVSQNTRGKISELSGSFTELSMMYKRLTAEEKSSPFGRAMAASIYQLKVRIKDLKVDLAGAESQLGGIGKAGIGAQFGAGLKSAFSMLGPAALAAGGVTAAIGGLKKVMGDIVSINMQFEQSAANLASVLGKSANEIAALTNQAKNLGATTRYTAMQILELQANLARMGFNETEILNSTKAVQGMATAMGADLGEAANLAGSALRGFGLNATEMERVASVLSVGTTKSALSFKKLATALPIVQTAAAKTGFTIEDTVAMLGKLTDNGINAASAATQLRKILNDSTTAGTKLANALGGPVKSFNELVVALDKAAKAGQTHADSVTLVNSKNATALDILRDMAQQREVEVDGVKRQTSALQDLRDSITDCSEGMRDMQKTQDETLSGSIKMLGSAWEGLMLTFSESNGVIKSVVDSLSSLLTAWTKWRNRNAGGDSAIKSYQLYGNGLDNKAKQGMQDIVKGYKAGGSTDEQIVAQFTKEKEAIEKERDAARQLYDQLAELDKLKGRQHDVAQTAWNKQFADMFKNEKYGYNLQTDGAAPDYILRQIAKMEDEIAKKDYGVDLLTAPEPGKKTAGEDEKDEDRTKSRLATLKAQYEEQEKLHIASLDRMHMKEEDYEAEVYRIKRETLQKIADLYQEETAEKARANAAISSLDIQYQGTQVRLANRGKGTISTPKEEYTGVGEYSTKAVAARMSHAKSVMDASEINSDRYLYEADKIVDLTTFQNLLKVATEAGMTVDTNFIKENLGQIDMGLGVPDSTWEELTAQINKHLANLGLDPIELDVKTGKVKAASEAAVSNAKDTATAWQNAVAAVNNVGSALQQIEDPAAKVSGIVMQAVANIALGFAQATASQATGAAGVFGWIAAATAGLATMVSTIAAIKSATAGSYANGGIIPGNSFSGDNQIASVNAGELILSRSQQANIASQLSGGATQTVVVEGRISGKDILLSANNTNRAAGGSRGYYTKVK